MFYFFLSFFTSTSKIFFSTSTHHHPFNFSLTPCSQLMYRLNTEHKNPFFSICVVLIVYKVEVYTYYIYSVYTWNCSITIFYVKYFMLITSFRSGVNVFHIEFIFIYWDTASRYMQSNTEHDKDTYKNSMNTLIHLKTFYFVLKVLLWTK